MFRAETLRQRESEKHHYISFGRVSIRIIRKIVIKITFILSSNSKFETSNESNPQNILLSQKNRFPYERPKNFKVFLGEYAPELRYRYLIVTYFRGT